MKGSDEVAKILTRLLDWGSSFEGFRESHAVNGLTCVRGYVDGAENDEGTMVRGIGSLSDSQMFVFAMQMAWIFWLDDRFDEGLISRGEMFGAEMNASIGVSEPITTQEIESFLCLARELELVASSQASLECWRHSCVRVVVAWGVEEQMSRRLRKLSYAEYLANGEDSSAVELILATAALVLGLSLCETLKDRRCSQLVKHLSLVSRLQNDYRSVDKERQEGCCANAVILMESSFGDVEQSQKFIKSEVQGYKTLLRKDIEDIGAEHWLCRLAQAMLASHERLYRTATAKQRYSPTAPLVDESADRKRSS